MSRALSFSVMAFSFAQLWFLSEYARYSALPSIHASMFPASLCDDCDTILFFRYMLSIERIPEFFYLLSVQSTQKKRVILYLTLSPPTDYTKGQFFLRQSKKLSFCIVLTIEEVCIFAAR